MSRFTRLRAIFAGLLTTCLLATVSSTLLILHSAEVTRSNTAGLIPLLEHAEEFERDILNARIAFIYHVTIDKPGSLETGWKHYREAEQGLAQLHAFATAARQDRLLAPRLDALDGAWAAYHTRLGSVLSLVHGGVRSGPAFDQAISEWAANGTTLVDAARDLVKTSTSLSAAQSQKAGDLLRFSTWITGLNGCMCLLLCATPMASLEKLSKRSSQKDVQPEPRTILADHTPNDAGRSLLSGLGASSRIVAGLAGMLALIIVVVGSGISALVNVVHLSSAQAANARAEQALLTAESLRALAYAAESDTRGFVFSGRQVLLVSHHTDVEAAWKTWGKLKQETGAESSQTAQVEELRVVMQQRFAMLQMVIDTRQRLGAQAVLPILATTQGLSLKHKLEDQIAALETAQYDCIAKGSLEADRATEMSKALIIFAALPASLSLVLLSIVTATSLARSKRLQRQLWFQAEHDALTGLPNRQSFERRLRAALNHAKKTETKIAVLAVDLDRFKEVNDRFGHQAGDVFLQQVSKRLRSALRQSDIILRFGGDEFVCLVAGIRGRADVEAVAHKLVSSLKTPIRLDSVDVKASVSVGYAIFPDHGETGQVLAVHADQALYRAKTLGRDRSCCFQESESELRARKIQKSLDSALAEQRFHLVYQPQYSPTGDLRGFEALLRLTDAELGPIPPAEFIPLAEHTSLILPISDWVLREACATFAGWMRAGLDPGMVAVNVSASHFAEADLPEKVFQLLRSTGLPGERLELEVTESLVMFDPEAAARQMTQMAQYGVRFAIDDFGTGFSSLSRLYQLPIELIKIDRSFIQALEAKTTSRPMVEATLALSKALHVETVAEGVETESQRMLLEKLGCTFLQGYLFSRPLERTAVEQLLLACAQQAKMRTFAEHEPASLVM